MFSCMGRRYSSPPDEHTYTFVVNGCAKGGLYGEGVQVHGRVLKSGFCSNVYVQSSLVDFYVKNGGKDGVAKARTVFDEMSERSIVTWNSLLLGSVRCGDIDGARRFFEEIPGKNVVSWTTMIAGLVQNGRSEEALGLFREMQSERVEFDQVTLVSVLSACAELGDLNLGKWIYSYVFEHFISQKKPVLATLQNSLVHMYASCGEIHAAFEVFKGMGKRTTVSWSTMINGFAKHGYGNEALSVFQWMQSTGSKDAKPDEITFLGVLCACSHSGYVNEGRNHFKSMVEDWGIKPTIEHFGCMVDLLSRAGLLDEAHDLVRSMPMKPNDIVWGALLGGCRIHKRVELASDVTELMIADIEPSRASAYFVLLSNVYAAAQKWEEVVAVRKKMLETKTKKITGRSWIQIDGSVYEFMAGDRSREKAGIVYDVLDDILREARFHGFIPYFADS